MTLREKRVNKISKYLKNNLELPKAINNAEKIKFCTSIAEHGYNYFISKTSFSNYKISEIVLLALHESNIQSDSDIYNISFNDIKDITDKQFNVFKSCQSICSKPMYAFNIWFDPRTKESNIKIYETNLDVRDAYASDYKDNDSKFGPAVAVFKGTIEVANLIKSLVLLLDNIYTAVPDYYIFEVNVEGKANPILMDKLDIEFVLTEWNKKMQMMIFGIGQINFEVEEMNKESMKKKNLSENSSSKVIKPYSDKLQKSFEKTLDSIIGIKDHSNDNKSTNDLNTNLINVIDINKFPRSLHSIIRRLKRRENITSVEAYLLYSTAAQDKELENALPNVTGGYNLEDIKLLGTDTNSSKAYKKDNDDNEDDDDDGFAPLV